MNNESIYLFIYLFIVICFVCVVAYVLDHPVSGMQFSCPDEAYPTRPLFAATDNETER